MHCKLIGWFLCEWNIGLIWAEYTFAWVGSRRTWKAQSFYLQLFWHPKCAGQWTCKRYRGFYVTKGVYEGYLKLVLVCWMIYTVLNFWRKPNFLWSLKIDIPVGTSSVDFRDLMTAEFSEGGLGVEFFDNCYDYQWKVRWMEVGGDKNEIKITRANITGEDIKYEVIGRGQFFFVIGYNNKELWNICCYCLLTFSQLWIVILNCWKSFYGNLMIKCVSL